VKGLFIVLEGIEGSGKSTQVRLLAERLKRAGIPHLLTREPGGTPVGEDVRQILLHKAGDLPVRAELLLMLTARAVLVETVVRPALEGGRVVIADRFALSTLAYQGYGRGLDLSEVHALNAFATGGLEPDVTLVIDVPLEEGTARRAAAGKHPDRIESAGEEFHRRVAGAYGLLASTGGNVQRVDGAGSPEEVSERIFARLHALFPETFGAAKG
jgi:dTMP kinase